MPNCARVQHFGMFRAGWGRWSPLSVQCMDDEIMFEKFFHYARTVPRLGPRGKARFLGRLVPTPTWCSIAASMPPWLRQVRSRPWGMMRVCMVPFGSGRCQSAYQIKIQRTAAEHRSMNSLKPLPCQNPISSWQVGGGLLARVQGCTRSSAEWVPAAAARDVCMQAASKCQTLFCVL